MPKFDHSEMAAHCFQSAVQGLHSSGILHNEIMQNIGELLSSILKDLSLNESPSACSESLTWDSM